MKIIIKQKSATCSEGTIRNHKVLCDHPQEKGGDNKGPMGGEFFLMGLGGCFTSNMLAAIKSRNANISNVKVEVEAFIEENPARFTKISLLVFADYDDEKQMEKIITIAEHACIVANSIKGSIILSTSLFKSAI